MTWHFPSCDRETVDNWNLDKYWVIYQEPAVKEMEEFLKEGDKKARQTHGYVVGADRPTTPGHHATWTWGVGKERRFTQDGNTKTEQKRSRSCTESPNRGRSEPRWMPSSP